MTFTAQVCRLLSEWITFLLAAVPPRSRRTFVELLCGCLMSQDGWVTRAISIDQRNSNVSSRTNVSMSSGENCITSRSNWLARA